jgi:DNA-binding LacI/PurR family transcriptional regulator
VPVLECAGSVRAEGRSAAARLLAGARPPTAILATSDVLAPRRPRRGAGGGRARPGDVSVVGFDDVPGAAEASLTTIRQDHHGKGRLAGELLLAALRGEQVPPPPALAHELVVRASTAPPS